MNADDTLAERCKLVAAIRSSEAYLADPQCRGGDRRAERNHLARLRRRYRELGQMPLDGLPATTGELGLLVGGAA